jgi:outer membrane usher protein
MRVVSTRKSSSGASEVVWRLLWALVIASGCGSAQAQEPGLSLRYSDAPSDPPRASPTPPESDLGGPPLGLTPSRELIFVPPPAPMPGADLSEVLLQVDVNSQGFNETVALLRSPQGQFFVAAEDLERWRLRVPSAVPLRREGKSYYSLDDLPGTTAVVDERRLTMQITTRPEAFVSTVDVVKRPQFPPPTRAHPGAFLNYQLSMTQFERERSDNGAFEAGFFSRYGVFTSGLLAPELGSPRDWVRLDSTFALDYPEKLTSFRFGDTLSRPGTWGRPVHLGGVQYGTNFNIQPGFIRTPVLEAAGSATVPSTVDVFVNNALARRTAVPPGPFSITNIPAINGAGEMRLVVTDLLGRQQVITQPYYGSIQLLKRGLEDFSYEAGLTRRDFAIESNHYGPPIGAATYRRGFTDGFTGELHAETSSGVRTVGPSGVFRAGNVGLVSGSYAVGHSDQGFGHLVGAGIEHTESKYNFSAIGQWATRAFRQVGMAAEELPRNRQTILTAGYNLGTLGAVSATRVVQDQRGQAFAEVVTLSYNVPIGRIATLSVNVQRILGENGSTGVHAAFVIPLGELTSAAVAADRTRSHATGNVENVQSVLVQKSLPYGDGYGYRLQTREKDFLAAGTLQTPTGLYRAEATRTGDNHDQALRLGAEGGLATIGGYYFASRNISDSFGVVRIADYPNVRILQDNQVVARTDKDGYAVLPRLRAYDRNQVTLDARDLPLDAVLGSLKLDAVPYYRSGVLLEFPIKRVRAATMTVALEAGESIPSGALARVEGKPDEFPVALRGELYLEGLEERSRVTVQWKGQACTLDVVYPKTDDPLPDLGTFVCKGVQP